MKLTDWILCLLGLFGIASYVAMLVIPMLDTPERRMCKKMREEIKVMKKLLKIDK